MGDAEREAALLPIIEEALGDLYEAKVYGAVLRSCDYDADAAIDALEAPGFDPSKFGGAAKKKPAPKPAAPAPAPAAPPAAAKHADPGKAEERRIDPNDGSAYTRAEFMTYYGDAGAWDRAKPAKGAAAAAPAAPKGPERRIDDEDGCAYTLMEFLEGYGDVVGEKRWRDARPAPQKKAPKPQQKPQAKPQPKAAQPKPAAKAPKPAPKPADPSPAAPSPSPPPPEPAGQPAAAPKPPKRSEAAAVAASDALPEQNLQEVADADGKYRINVIVVGHVDAGKSTIMGHILVKLGVVSQRVMHKYEKESRATGKASFHFAWVLDETQEERERGVTMDIATTYFETDHRRVTLLDAPGHREFVTNMIAGATQADNAVLVVNAVTGEFEAGFSDRGQTKEHVVLLRSVGVSRIIVAVNKLDTCDYSQARFEEIQLELSKFLRQNGFRDQDVTYVPVAGLPGENLIESTEPRLKEWYSGPSLLGAIDALPPPRRLVEYPLRLCISDVLKSTTLGNCIGGKIETGRVSVGDKLVIMPYGDSATVKGIECAQRAVKTASAGDNVEVGLQGIDMDRVAVGHCACSAAHAPVRVSQRFEAQLMGFYERGVTKGFQCTLHLQSTQVDAQVARLVSLVDPKTGEPTGKKPKSIPAKAQGIVEITTGRPVCIELAKEFRSLGRFMIRCGGTTAGAGIITKIFVTK